MKFLPRHQKDLHDMIEKCGFEQSTFTFVKRRGRIMTYKRDSNLYFSYIQKRESSYNPTEGTLADSSKFYIHWNGGQEKEVDAWTQVMDKFRSWLDQLDEEES